MHFGAERGDGRGGGVRTREAEDLMSGLERQRRDYSQQRQLVIDANAELRERELIKMASLSAAFADGLRRRGVMEPDASLAAEAGIVVLRVGFERWVREPYSGELRQIMRALLDRLPAVTTAR